MTDSTDSTITGEQRLRSRRNKFWTYCALGFVIAAAAGAVSGLAGQGFKDGVLPLWALIACWAAVAIGFVWFTRDYYSRVDELDLSDNLWANTVALYGYLVLLGSWQFFHEAGLVIEPQQWIIAGATLGILFLSYFARRLGLR